MSDLRVACPNCNGHYWSRAFVEFGGKVVFVADPHACRLGPYPLPSFVPPDTSGWAEGFDTPKRAPLLRLCHGGCGALLPQPRTGGRTLRCPPCRVVQTRAIVAKCRKARAHVNRDYRRRYWQEKGA